MIRSNGPHSHRNIKPDPEQVVGSMQIGMPGPRLKDGLYYRGDLSLDMEEIEGKLLASDGTATLLDFQYYAQAAWKTPQGTRESQERFSDKVAEEYAEVIEAIDEHINKIHRSTEDLELESGDLLWCLAALASNGGADLDAGLKHRLYSYVRGTQWVIANQPVPPIWRPNAYELAGKYEPLTLAEVDSLLEAGFEPTNSPVLNIYDPEPDDLTIGDHILALDAALRAARIIADNQYGSEGRVSTGSEFENLALQLGELTAYAILETAYLNHRTTGASLASIIGKNVQKLNDRVAKNHVDKSDRL